MSIHKSLTSKGKLVRTRNVLKRAERIMELERAGKWRPEEHSPFGLPKVRVLKVKKRAKEKKKEEGAEAGKAVAAAPETAAPAGTAKAPAAGKEAKAPAAKEAKKS